MTMRGAASWLAFGVLGIAGFIVGSSRGYSAPEAVPQARMGIVAGRTRLPESDFLSGYDLGSGKPVVMDKPDDGLYYFVDPACAACAISYPTFGSWLDRTSDFALIRFVSAEPNRKKLLRYFSRHPTPFRVIGGIRGSLFDAVPKQYKPILVSVTGGEITGLVLGGINQSRAHLIDSLVKKLGRSPNRP